MSLSRRHLLAACAAPAILSASPLRAQTKPKVSYAYLLDPAYDAVVWAIKNGKVRSNLIDVEVSGIAIPHLHKVTSTKQTDLATAAVIACPGGYRPGL